MELRRSKFFDDNVSQTLVNGIMEISNMKPEIIHIILEYYGKYEQEETLKLVNKILKTKTECKNLYLTYNQYCNEDDDQMNDLLKKWNDFEDNGLDSPDDSLETFMLKRFFKMF